MVSTNWSLASKCGNLIWVKGTSRVELYSELTPSLIVARESRGGSAVDYVKFSAVVSVRQQGPKAILLERKKSPMITLIAEDAAEARLWFEAIQLSMTKYQSSTGSASAKPWVESSMNQKPPLPAAERYRTNEQNHAMKDARVVEVNGEDGRKSIAEVVRVREENFPSLQNRVEESLGEAETTLPYKKGFADVTNNNSGSLSDASTLTGEGNNTTIFEEGPLHEDEISVPKPKVLDSSQIKDDYVMNYIKELKENSSSGERASSLRPPDPFLFSVGASDERNKKYRFKEMPPSTGNEEPSLHNQVHTMATERSMPVENPHHSSPFAPSRSGLTARLQGGNAPGFVPPGKELSGKMLSSAILPPSADDAEMHQKEGAKLTGYFVETLQPQGESIFGPHVTLGGSPAPNAAQTHQTTNDSQSSIRQANSLVNGLSQYDSFAVPSPEARLLGSKRTPSSIGDNSGARVYRINSLEKRQSREILEESHNVAQLLDLNPVKSKWQNIRESILDRLSSEVENKEECPTPKDETSSGNPRNVVPVTLDSQQTPSDAQKLTEESSYGINDSSQSAPQASGNFVVDRPLNIPRRRASRDKFSPVFAAGRDTAYYSLRSPERENFYFPVSAAVSVVSRRGASSERLHYGRARSTESRGTSLSIGFNERELFPRRNSRRLSDSLLSHSSDYFVVRRNSPSKWGNSPRLSPPRWRSPDAEDRATGISQRRDRETFSRDIDVENAHDECLQSRSARKGRSRSRRSRRPPREEEQHWRCTQDVLMEPCLATKHDVCGYGREKCFFCLTQDARCVVSIPFEDYTHKNSVSSGTPLSLDAAISTYGVHCRAIAIKNIDHVAIGSHEAFVQAWYLHSSVAERLVCVVSKTHAFAFEVESSVKASNLVKTWKTFLRSASL